MKQYKDKILHFVVCFVITAFWGYFITPWLSSLIAGAIALSIGLAKEVIDGRTIGNHFCWWDLLADIVGILTGIGILILIK